MQVNTEVEVQLAAQIDSIHKEHARATQEAAKLARTLERQAAEMQKVQSRKEQARARK